LAEEVPDMLIFNRRTRVMDGEPAEQAWPKSASHESIQQYTKPETEIVPFKPQTQLNAKAQVEPEIKSSQKPAEQAHTTAPAPAKKSIAQAAAPSTKSLTVARSLKIAKSQFCVNHPWRHAYAICDVCKLPYCYVDIMEDQGKLYCMNDINFAIYNPNSTGSNPSINMFSIISSIVLLANSAVLGYFMYPQISFLAKSAANAGASSILLHLSSAYYIPLLNIAVAIFGIIAAITVLRRSIYGFGFSLFVSFFGLLLVLYEYLISSDTYLFISSTLMLISLASLTYSRMSSSKEVVEDKLLTPDIEWPKPETF